MWQWASYQPHHVPLHFFFLPSPSTLLFPILKKNQCLVSRNNSDLQRREKCYFLFKKPYVEEAVFVQCVFWDSLQKLSGCSCWGLCLGSLFCCFDLYDLFHCWFHSIVTIILWLYKLKSGILLSRICCRNSYCQ